MYYAFFGLKQPPFRITPDTDFFFEGGNRGAVLEAPTCAIMRGEGIVKVTGEVGSGKTMLCRVLQARLPPTVETVYLANPSVSPEEILHAIAFELQLPLAVLQPADCYPMTAAIIGIEILRACGKLEQAATRALHRADHLSHPFL